MAKAGKGGKENTAKAANRGKEKGGYIENTNK